MSERVTSGTTRLDSVLGGGLPRNAISLVIGAPGSGKTIFAQQIVYANVDADHTAVYFSTVSEPLEKILRFGQELTFFDRRLVGSQVLYEDLGVVLGAQGLDGVLERIRGVIQEQRPSLMVIDSFKALRPYTDESGFRQFLQTLSGLVSAFPVTSVWVGEYDMTELATGPEFAVADAIISMGTGHQAERRYRAMEVVKLRGGDHLSGRHAYRISVDGILAYPRLADPGVVAPYDLGAQRRSSGIGALDEMLADGYQPGTSVLVAGPTGAGKTLMGLHFIFGGASYEEPGVIATLQENPTQLQRICNSFGWSLDNGNVTLMYRSPVDLYIDEWVYELLDTVEATGATRVVIDSLSDLQVAASDDKGFREYVYSLLHRCSRRGISVLMTYEVPELYGITRLTEYGASHLADNVVLLHYKGFNEGTIARTLTVLKTRASSHDRRVRQFDITPKGVVLSDEDHE